MDRLAGATAGDIPTKAEAVLPTGQPYGVGVGFQGTCLHRRLKGAGGLHLQPRNQSRRADQERRAGAFRACSPGWRLDDSDRLFSPTANFVTSWFSTKHHKVEAIISQGIVVPGGMAVDNENRFLYVADTGVDQVAVFDADPPFKFIRAIGTRSGKHDLTNAGRFLAPDECCGGRRRKFFRHRHFQQPRRGVRC